MRVRRILLDGAALVVSTKLPSAVSTKLLAPGRLRGAAPSPQAYATPPRRRRFRVSGRKAKWPGGAAEGGSISRERYLCR